MAEKQEKQAAEFVNTDKMLDAIERQAEQLAAAEAKVQAIIFYHHNPKPKNTSWMEWYEAVVKLAEQEELTKRLK